MVAVDADDAIVAELLTSTLALVLEAGGSVAADLTVVAREGQLHLESHSDGVLVRVPREAFVRVDTFAFAEDAGRIFVTDVSDDATDIELELMYTSVALANQCGKLAWMRLRHPALASDVPQDVGEAVQAVIPSFRSHPYDAVSLYWGNRCFKIDLGDGPERVLVPIVDLLNHHSQGAIGDWEHDSFSVQAARPFGTAECALDYGMERDALTFAVVYGFLDESNVRNGVDPALLDTLCDIDTTSAATHLLRSAARHQRVNPFG